MTIDNNAKNIDNNAKDDFYEILTEHVLFLKEINEQYKDIFQDSKYQSKKRLKITIDLLESFIECHKIKIIYVFLDNYKHRHTNCVNITYDFWEQENWAETQAITRKLDYIRDNDSISLMENLINEYKIQGGLDSKVILTRPEDLDSKEFLSQFRILLGREIYSIIQSMLFDEQLVKKEESILGSKIKI